MSEPERPPPSPPPTSRAPEAPASWERSVIERLATQAVVEQRRARRWGIFFKFVFLAYVTALVLPYVPFHRLLPAGEERHSALVEVEGLIAPDAQASADRIITGLRAAFEDANTAGVIVRINSPGGSPVQSGYINDEIHRLREKYPQIPLYAVITDVCASGGYYVAAAAERIYADKSSIVGSIGVLMNGFGFVEAMDKLGVERRLLTAGEHKGFLDPFSPIDPGEVAHVKGLLAELHQQFIAVVRRGRGDRLRDEASLFSGLVWSGEESVRLGLVDALGTSSGVAREVIGAEKLVNFTVRESLVERIAERLGASFARAVVTALGLRSLGGAG